jgi:hypothetical protein
MPNRVLTAGPAVVRAALGILAEGPIEPSILVRRLEAAAIELGPRPDERLVELLDTGRTLELADGRLVDVAALAEGREFSHDLSTPEIDAGEVAVDPDLVVVHDVVPAGVALPDDGGWVFGFDDEGRVLLKGPPGWLASASEGDRLTARIERARVSFDVSSDPIAVGDEAVEALRGTYDRLGRGDDEIVPVDLTELWWEAAATSPAAFDGPQAPLGRMLSAAALELRDSNVAPAGYPWHEWELAQEVEQIVRRWRLDEAGREAFLMATAIFERFATGTLDDLGHEDGEEGEEVDLHQVFNAAAAMLSYERVAPAFVGEVLGGAADEDALAASFCDAVLAEVSGPTRAGPLWVKSISAERAGRTLDAETLVHQALAADRDFVPALTDAAWYAADRGDARQAASLLARAGDDADGDDLEMFQRFARTPPAVVGRNDPCPCGSGRKYKFCHQGRGTLPLAERYQFLYFKGLCYLRRPSRMPAMLEIAFALAGDDAGPAGVGQALGSAFTVDLALFEGGIWGEFLRDRAVLLPGDEVLLAQQWQLIERSLHQVEALQPGRGVTTRDVRTGAVVDVAEHEGSRRLHVGDVICARIVPDGEGMRLLGGVELIPAGYRDELRAVLDTHPGAVELASWFARAKEPQQSIHDSR